MVSKIENTQVWRSHFFVLGALLVKIGVLSGTQMATQNDTGVWGPWGTDASVSTVDAHGVPLGAFGLLFTICGVILRVLRAIFVLFAAVFLQLSLSKSGSCLAPKY